ncbi:response regulator [Arcobacter sp. FWKO B]|uniref:response regulator n=1 Tax=Arcobacter sp. FWKO B TaxID=2593672 RepID=UPI0018A4AEFC|nr:response regulator [Arcobacter sp. FWKO B]QOG12734.1 PAS domain S-box protein [Arcobacter sp. FWKO B]
MDNSEKKILIIEDSKSINNILLTHFQSVNFKGYQAFNLKDAKELLEKEEFDYCVLDVHLPDGNGYEVLEILNKKDIKIFILTTEKDNQLKELSYKKGVIDFIIKDKDFFSKVKQLIQEIQQLEDNKNYSVLVIEDSFVVQQQLKDLLENRNFKVFVKDSASSALDLIANEHIDLILLDLHLKDTNGLDFLNKNKYLLIEERKIAIIIISGNIEANSLRDAVKLGAKDILKKPYSYEELVLKVDMCIEDKRREKGFLSNVFLMQQYKDTIDRSAMVSKTNHKGIITYVNDEFCRISGYSADELMGKNHNIVRHADMPKDAFELMWYTIKDLKQPWSGEVKNRKKDGSAYWVQSIISPILDSHGDVIEYIGIRNDITQQKTISSYFENQLKISTSNFDEAMNLSREYEKAIINNSAIAKLELDFTIKFVNDQYLLLSKYSSEEMIGKPIVDFVDEESLTNLEEIIQQVQSGVFYQGIFKGKPKHGEPYYTKTTINPIKDTKGNTVEYLLIKNDITKLINTHHEIEATQKEIVYKMGEVGESRSKETGNHVKRVAEYSRLLALLYGLSPKEADILFTASPMHDIGKVAIPDSILNKPAKLTQEEFEIMKSHASIGYKVLQGSDRAVLKAASIVAHEHHEKYNGTGYPRGLQGEEIHIYGRITAIADVFDALGHDRCYKKAWELDKILALFEEEKGKHFDPKLIDLFMDNLDKFLEIRDRLNDEY